MDDVKFFIARQEGSRVLLIFNGKLVATLPWQAAKDVAKAIHMQSKAAEEFDKALTVIGDEAFLIRTGAPFSLTSNPKIRQEAFKESQYLNQLPAPPLIPSSECVGTPTIIGHPGKGT